MSVQTLDRRPSTESLTPAERQRRGDALLVEASQFAEGRDEALREVVELYLPVARSMAVRFRNRGCELEDLEQVAGLGLTRAVQGFDPSAGYDFLAYAVPSIRGTLRRHFRDYGWTVRPPRSMQELQPRVRHEQTLPDPATGRPPSEEQIALRLGATTAAVHEASSILGCFTPASLDAPVGTAGGGVLGDLVGGQDEAGFDAVDNRSVLSAVLLQLTRDQRELLQLRFVEELSQEQIAQLLGTGQSQVSRRIRLVLDELREMLGADAQQPTLAS